jgi:hypothetical protein
MSTINNYILPETSLCSHIQGLANKEESSVFITDYLTIYLFALVYSFYYSYFYLTVKMDTNPAIKDDERYVLTLIWNSYTEPCLEEQTGTTERRLAQFCVDKQNMPYRTAGNSIT